VSSTGPTWRDYGDSLDLETGKFSPGLFYCGLSLAVFLVSSIKYFAIPFAIGTLDAPINEYFYQNREVLVNSVRYGAWPVPISF